MTPVGRALGSLKHLESLDGLRYLASLQVALSHLNFLWHPLVWAAMWTQFFFLLSGFVLAYAEMMRPAGQQELSVLRYTLRRLRNLYPPYLAILLISMVQWSHSDFEWHTVIFNLLLLQAWFPLIDRQMHPPRPIAVSWVAVALFLSALMLYWQLLRPAARLARKMSMRVALVSLFGLWLCTILILLAWSLGGVHDSDFMLAILKFGPLGYIHVFLSGVVLARVFVLLVCVDAATGDTPDAETEDFELSTGQLPWILEFGSCLALVIYVLIVMLRLDPWKATGFYAFCHNGGILPIMCLLLLACATEEDAMVPLLTSRVGKMLGRISYCQYLVQTNLEQAVRPWLDLAVQHGIGLWVGLPVYLLTLVFTAYVFEALVSALVRRAQDLATAAVEKCEGSSIESSSEEEKSLQ